MTDHDGVMTAVCPACAETVPAGPFCGQCGAAAKARVSAWVTLLRPSVYAAAHREPVWTPRVRSTLFPRLAGAMRRPYRSGLAVIGLAMVLFAVVRLPGMLAVTVIIGGPLLFLMYLWQTDAFSDLPRRILFTSMVLGLALGIGWWLLAGAWLADAYDVSTGSALMLRRALQVGMLITAVGGVLMVVPAVITRLFRVPVRESLDGFVVGASGALGYLAASEATIIVPQVVEGLLGGYGPARLLNRAVTHGVVSPIAVIAAGGLLGLSLWFRPGRRAFGARQVLAVCALVAVSLYPTIWWVDEMKLPALVDVAVKLGLAVLALILIRCAVQIALLHETLDPGTGAPVLCVHCERVVPDLPFCSACGVAARASSRSSRRHRVENRPVRQPAAQGS